MHFGLRACLVAALLAGPAHATSLATLVAGNDVVVGDVTFSNFTYNDLGASGGFGVASSAIEVTGFSSGTNVWLDFTLAEDAGFLSDGDALEFEIGFTTTVTSGPRRLTDVEATLDDASVDGGVEDFAFVQIGSNDLGGQEAAITLDNGASVPVSIGQALANLDTFAFVFDLQAEAEGLDASAVLRSFDVGFTLSGDATVVPLPGTLPLMLAGLAGFAGVRRFWRR